ncbi:hypothetical protein D1AOALGA4SA_4019 [Olavius algarvensis Delta 1 endosymbiont]|nr:hypothetical protein D1AOALGA4SA_4019 [Olavius algarvensis Delta 1 endosymbiont]
MFRLRRTAGQINGRSNRKKTLWLLVGCFRTVGAVFNRDSPGNRGRPATSSVESRPLPPTIYFNFDKFGFFEDSYKDLS